MKVGIVGGGMSGLTLAMKLSSLGNQVDVFEKEDQPGGLATYHDYEDFIWDKFYHVILPTDKALLGLIDELGLSDQLRWKQTFTGVYVDKSFYSVSTSKEFLLFPALNLFQKFRLALTILIGSRIKNSSSLENTTSEEWLIKYSGKTTYEKFWKPLLVAKLGRASTRVSAVFIWSYIKRLFDARSSSTDKKESMAYVSGGYKTIFDRICSRLQEKNCNIELSSSIKKIEVRPDNKFNLMYDDKIEIYDKIIFTAPVPSLIKIVPSQLFEVEGDVNRMEYLGVICQVLILKKELTPYYVLNIADNSIPFTGVIGMSTLVDRNEFNGNSMVYLPKYVEFGDPYWEKTDMEIEADFLEALFKMYPEYDRKDLVSSQVHRAKVVQPLQVKNYSSIVPKAKSNNPNFYVVNSAQIFESTLNNNSITTIVNSFISEFGSDFK